ncbi:acyl-CoA thioesterase [Alteromonas sp. ASW11-36]|uniref:Acyl-CoA thioesterase n=1 Tax=Alteromonas arenosi TaxID=3055817 RepID=A0ABT7SXX7_9ALTE|nr:acyl-CoA thioesterase [Alteromonas sp. ASW11-36]MDM7861037.1 acyl-CoA thioesterase [Alteromonas sp. ASW11-36]
MQTDVYLRVRFAECDPQNVVFNARYADYVDVASTEYMRFLCNGYEQLEAQGWMTQVVNLNIRWFASAQFDDVLHLAMKCERVGNTSFVLNCDISRLNDLRKIAEASAVYVMLDTHAQTKCAVPQWLRDSLLEDKVCGPVNLAGTIQERSE